MIPTIKAILEGYRDGSYSLEQCIGWLEQHQQAEYQRGYDSGYEVGRDMGDQ